MSESGMNKEDWEMMIKFFGNTKNNIDVNYKLINNLISQISIISEKIDLLSKKIDLHDERTIGE